MKLIAIASGLLSALTLCTFDAHAGPQAQTLCAYHHTLGDDAIMMFGKAGQAILYDFFGNTHTDASSTWQTLRTQPETSCDNQADSSAWWAPSLKLPDGEVVKPAWQKTYYQASGVDKYPLHPFPAGLELLAGDHRGTGPNASINFLCSDAEATHTAGEVCGLRKSGDAVQFNIGILFPNCWDGTHLKPTRDHSNAAYADNGKCPADYPIKLPGINMNIAYVMPHLTSLDTSKIQLSLDPTLNGNHREEHWGSIYTAHADFMNGWREESAHFMTEMCMNNDMDCGSNVPYAWSKAEENTWVSSQRPNTHNDSPARLEVRDDWSNGGRTHNSETLALIKFKIPHLPAGMDTSLFKYRVRLYGSTVEKNGTHQIFLYPTSNSWNTRIVTWNTRPAANYNADGSLYINNTREYRYVDVDKAVRKALAEGKSEISWYIGGDRQGNHYEFYPEESRQSLVLMLTGYKKVSQS